jgi:uncharacterized membrane protein YuzA (DUF378 family)
MGGLISISVQNVTSSSISILVTNTNFSNGYQGMDLQIHSPTLNYTTNGLWGLNNPPIAGQIYTINFSQFTSANSNFMSDRVLGNTYNIYAIVLGGGSANAIPFTIPSSAERFTSPNVESPTMHGMKLAHMIATILLIVGGLNWGSKAILGKDLLSKVLGDFPLVTRVIFGLVGLAALAVMFHRDTYLPFLGETVLPCAVLAEKTPDGANTTVSVTVEPGAKVLFWAAEPGSDALKTVSTWQEAYLKFANAGVTTADGSGHARLRVRHPQPYTVPLKGTLAPHVHYRVCRGGGMMDPVQTTFVDNVAEGFAGGKPIKKPSSYDPDTLEDGGAAEEGWSGAEVGNMSGATAAADWTTSPDGDANNFAAAATSHPTVNSLMKEGFTGSSLQHAFRLPLQ